MMRSPAIQQPIDAAYDAIAHDYDRLLGRDMWIRRILWRHFERAFHVGDHILDVGCGTGIDTVHLASRGFRVTAVDISPRMTAALQAKVADSRFAGLVKVRTEDVNRWDDESWGGELRFDGIVSSFAALNTIDLESFAETAARLLRSGGRIIGHFLSRHAGSLSGEPHIPVGGKMLRHALSPPHDLYGRFFRKNFLLRKVYGVGFRPMIDLAHRLPLPLSSLLGRIESVVGSIPPLVDRGRFFVLDLERRS